MLTTMSLLKLLLTISPLLSITAASPAPTPKESPKPKPCTLHSPTTGSFFDLNPISLTPPAPNSKSDERHTSWHARGHDYGANFTINICAPVIEDLAEMGGVEGIEEKRWANVSAYYEVDGERFSIGQSSSEPIFRGRKLVLNYTDGSPCPKQPMSSLLDITKRREKDEDDEDDDNDDDDRPKKSTPVRTKSTILSFLCDSTPLTSAPTISFVGSPDSCSYFFEVRSSSSCGGHASDRTQTLSPLGVFGIIAGIAVAVYLVGGCAYQRIVLNQRGWRQCPNGNVWRSLASFVGDMAVILTSSCAQFLSRSSTFAGRRGGGRGYSRLSISADDAGAGGRGRGRERGYARNSRTADDENRLIDQLDEEWDD